MEDQQIKTACKNYSAVKRIDKSLQIINEEKVEKCDYCGKNHETFQLTLEELEKKLAVIETRNNG